MGAGIARTAAMTEMIWWEKAATRTSREATGATRRTSAGVDVERLGAVCLPAKAV